MVTETPVPGSLPATALIAKRASVAPITNDQLFQWAQLQFPELFGSAAPNVIANLPYNGQLFDVREYPGGAYLGISQGRVFGLGRFTNGQLVDFGTVQSFAAQVCSRISCTVNQNPIGIGSLNGCTMPAGEALRAGNRYTFTYKNDVFPPFAPVVSSGEFTAESVVDGSTSFEGQSAIKITSRARGTQMGESFDVTSASFEQIAENGLTRSLGSEVVEAFVTGIPLTLRTVNTPPVLNNEFTLQPGQSINQTTTSTSTFINAPFSQPPFTGSNTVQITYEGRETINVLGRNYDTCRYKTTTASDDEVNYEWYIVGNGFAARAESRTAAGAVLTRIELRRATINGAAI